MRKFLALMVLILLAGCSSGQKDEEKLKQPAQPSFNPIESVDDIPTGQPYAEPPNYPPE